MARGQRSTRPVKSRGVRHAKEGEGAYSFLESSQASAKTFSEDVFSATAERARAEPYVYVVIDSSSLSLPHETLRKGFGPVRTRHVPVSGLMVTSALAVAGDGTPLGLIYHILLESLQNAVPVEVSSLSAQPGASLRRQGARALRSRCTARHRASAQSCPPLDPHLPRSGQPRHPARAVERGLHFHDARELRPLPRHP